MKRFITLLLLTVVCLNGCGKKPVSTTAVVFNPSTDIEIAPELKEMLNKQVVEEWKHKEPDVIKTSCSVDTSVITDKFTDDGLRYTGINQLSPEEHSWVYCMLSEDGVESHIIDNYKFPTNKLPSAIHIGDVTFTKTDLYNSSEALPLFMHTLYSSGYRCPEFLCVDNEDLVSDVMSSPRELFNDWVTICNELALSGNHIDIRFYTANDGVTDLNSWEPITVCIFEDGSWEAYVEYDCNNLKSLEDCDIWVDTDDLHIALDIGIDTNSKRGCLFIKQ